MMKKGKRVEVLDDVLSGIVVAIKNEMITIESDEGFLLTFRKDELVEIEDFSISKHALQEALIEKQAGIKNKKIQTKKKERHKPPLEVDLHLHELKSSVRNMSNFELLNMQLNTARQQLEFAMKKHIQRVIFIHGVGEGVLRAELETLLRRYDQIEFYDADFAKYGRGATEVRIFQN